MVIFLGTILSSGFQVLVFICGSRMLCVGLTQSKVQRPFVLFLSFYVCD